MDRRQFLLAAAAAPVALRLGKTKAPLAYATADTESHVAVVDMDSGAIVRRIETLPSPFSIERVGETAVVAHTVSGRLTIVGRHVVGGLGSRATPRRRRMGGMRLSATPGTRSSSQSTCCAV